MKPPPRQSSPLQKKSCNPTGLHDFVAQPRQLGGKTIFRVAEYKMHPTEHKSTLLWPFLVFPCFAVFCRVAETGFGVSRVTFISPTQQNQV